MSIANSLVLPNLISNGQVNDAVPAMANWSYLLLALNRALLDSGSGAGMNAQSTQIHNLADGSSPQDAAAFHQIADAVAAGGFAPLASPAFTGNPTAPTPAPGDNDTSVATTAFVTAVTALLAPLASPTFTGDPKAPTASPGDNDTSIATTAFVTAAIAVASALLQTKITFTSNGNGWAFGIAIGGTTYYLQFVSVFISNPASGTAFSWPVAFPTTMKAVPGGMQGLTSSGSYSAYLNGAGLSGGTAFGNNGAGASSTVGIIAVGY